MLRKGPVAAAAAFAYRVRTPGDVDKAEALVRLDGFAYTREPGEERGFRLGSQL
ncbi:hypothetical protein ABIB29_000648 [Arthrobacter sp. UYEF36]